jgi:hypothetical protein
MPTIIKNLLPTLFILIIFSTSGLCFTHLSHSTKKLSEISCLRCHGNEAPTQASNEINSAPLLEQKFSMQWNMFEVKSQRKPKPYKILRGETHYDWQKQIIVENYFDECINIFASGNNFSCKFISKKNKTYLVKYKLGNFSSAKSCCMWSSGNFYAPRPDVLKNMLKHKTTINNGEEVNWWLLDSPSPGPFGFGTLKNNIPYAFWFPVIGAFVQQEFYDYKSQKPADLDLAVPQICIKNKLKICQGSEQ